ncbi:MAG: HAD family hydrolase [Breznakiellaceae bacterium]|jgi:putative hydrolase of the HAD superfamily
MDEQKKSEFLALIRESLRPLKPEEVCDLPGPLQERLYPSYQPQDWQIRGMLFDVYGTLLQSAAGDIAVQTEYLRGSADAVALWATEDMTGEELKAFFRDAVQAEHLRQYATTPYPEVRVEELWARLPGKREDVDPQELALRYELAINPVYPMPHLEECLRELGRGSLVLGIVSNAQFYTPLMLEAVLGKSLEAAGFALDLCIYSFEVGEAKPSPTLFKQARGALEKRGVGANQVLYVGNDMLNDVYGAHMAGFKTALFAGDGRSLRLRENNRLCQNLVPDLVIRDLSDLVWIGGL